MNGKRFTDMTKTNKYFKNGVAGTGVYKIKKGGHEISCPPFFGYANILMLDFTAATSTVC